jgi:hypothetical protein
LVRTWIAFLSFQTIPLVNQGVWKSTKSWRPQCLFGKQADGLWRLGRYQEAAELLAKYEGTDAHWLLLRLVIATVIATTGSGQHEFDRTESSKRLRAAQEATGEERISRYHDVLKVDGMSQIAWYNIGMLFSEAEQFQDASEAFLIAALIWPGDIDAWANAIACLGNLRKGGPETSSAVFALALVAGAQMDREGLFRKLSIRIRSKDGTPSALTRELIKLVEPLKRVDVIRVSRSDGYSEFPVDDVGSLKRFVDELMLAKPKEDVSS